MHLKLLTDAIARKFPPLANIRIDHSWWGWVDMSHDMMPRITQPVRRQEDLVRGGLRRQRRRRSRPGPAAPGRAHLGHEQVCSSCPIHALFATFPTW